MTHFASQTLPTDFPHHLPDRYLPQCKLKWRQRKLLIDRSPGAKQPHLASLDSKQGLVECLKHSPVQLVCIDPTLGEAVLLHWADACEQAKKPVFLRRTTAQNRFWKPSKFSDRIKRIIDWIAALLLLILLSPVILALVVLMQIYSPGPIFSGQWHVWAKGRLFRVFKFRTSEVNDESRTTLLGGWISKYSLGKLPQLFNVLRGEMSLFGPRPLTLSEAVNLGIESQRRLKALRGNTPVKSVEVTINRLDLAG